MQIVYKDSGQIADVSHLDGIVVLYASAFGNMDSDEDIIARGAFKKTIQEQGPRGVNRIKHLWMHWPDQILGAPLELEEDAVGLRVVSKVSKTQIGRDALILYDEGIITEHSVGISHIQRDDTDMSIIKQARLWEYSAVTWGANPLTPTVDVKTMLGREESKAESTSVAIPTPIEKQILIAGRALSTGISDELCQRIESWLKLIKGQVTQDPIKENKGPATPQIDELLTDTYDFMSPLQDLVTLSNLHLYSRKMRRSHARSRNQNAGDARRTVEKPA